MGVENGGLRRLGRWIRKGGPESLLAILVAYVMVAMPFGGPGRITDNRIIELLCCLTGAVYGVWAVRHPFRAIIAVGLAMLLMPQVDHPGPLNEVTGPLAGCFVAALFGAPVGVVRSYFEDGGKPKPSDWDVESDRL